MKLSHMLVVGLISLSTHGGAASAAGALKGAQGTVHRSWRIPILMYHYVEETMRPGDLLGKRLAVSPEVLARQLDALKSLGYRSANFRRLSTGNLPRKAIILTFDDGYEDAYTAALPVLKAHGMVATFFIVPGFLGKPGYLTWHQLIILHDAGMEIGAHSMTHSNLAKLTAGQQRHEIDESIRELEEKIGEPIRSFAYPSGRYSRVTVGLVQKAGIAFAVTTKSGTATSKDDPWRLPRVRVQSATDFQRLLH